MKEGCKEALRETLAVSPALSITAYLSNCLYIQPHTQKNNKMAAGFFYSPGGGRGTETDRVSDLAVKFAVVLKDNFSVPGLLPATVRAAVRGPELTKLLLGK